MRVTGPGQEAFSQREGTWQRVITAVMAARHAGSGPVCAYVYDLDTVRRQARSVVSDLPPGWSLFYAVKANANPSVLATLGHCVDGFEVASLGELRAAQTAIPGAATIMSGPGKTDADLSGALRHGVSLLNVESLHELRRIGLVATRLGVVAPVALRVNRRASIALGSHQMTGPSAQFGLDEGLLPEAVALAKQCPAIDLRGFHLHAFSNNTDAAAHARFLTESLTWSVTAARQLDVELRVVNFGGGIGVDYTSGTSPFDFDLLGSHIAHMARPPGTQLVLELGRYLVATAGWYAAEVLDVRTTHSRAVAVLRGGMHHFRLPSAWRHSHPFVVLPVAHWPYPFSRPEVTNVPVDLVGELCTPRDVFARGAFVETLRAGDIVVFPLAGAYGWEISHRDFLQHPYPEFLILPVAGPLTPR